MFRVLYGDDGLIAALEFAMDDLVSELLSIIATGGGIEALAVSHRTNAAPCRPHGPDLE